LRPIHPCEIELAVYARKLSSIACYARELHSEILLLGKFIPRLSAVSPCRCATLLRSPRGRSRAISRVICALYRAFARVLSFVAEVGDGKAALVEARLKSGAALTSASLVVTMLS
jgi:hypothetical protein